ncbi:hypothetical protein KI387_014981, partial [Taxus chinensis]
ITECTQAQADIARVTGDRDTLLQASLAARMGDMLLDIMISSGEASYYKVAYHQAVPDGNKITPFDQLD